MAKFVKGVPVVLSDPSVTVDADGLAPGVHRFQLVVVDDSGNESDPTFIEVVVKDVAKPTAVLDVVNAQGQRVSPSIAAGQPFVLSGARSTDLAPGKIKSYRFTLVDR